MPSLSDSFSFLRGYPEIFLALSCFFLLHRVVSRKGPLVDWPVVGMLPSLLWNLHRIHDFATDVMSSAGCTFLMKGPWGAGMDLLVTADPANVNYVFNANFANYPKGDDFLEIFEILGGGIFNADDESWKAQRRMVHGLMAESRFRAFVTETSQRKVNEGLVPLLELAIEEGSAVDLQDLFLRFTFDVTSMLIMGVDPGCLSPGLPVVPFAKAMDDAEEVQFFRHTVPRSWWRLLKLLGVGVERKHAEAWEAIDKYVGEQLSKKKEQMCKMACDDGDKEAEAATASSPDLISSFLDGRKQLLADKSNNGLDFRSRQFLRDTVVNLMLAGRDTTAAGLSWFFWSVLKNPAVESKLLEELKSSIKKGKEGEEETLVTFDAQELSSLVYLHAAVLETLRLYPPVPFEHKGAVMPDVLPSGHRIDDPRRTKLMVSLYAMARMEGVWGADCREFRPERWISGRGTVRHEPSYKFLSFNSGPRTCLGKDIAVSQMKAAAATLLYNFRVEVVGGGEAVVPKTSIILHMKDGLMVRVSRRGGVVAVGG